MLPNVFRKTVLQRSLSYCRRLIKRSYASCLIKDNIVHSPIPELAYERGNLLNSLYKNFEKKANKVFVESSETGQNLTFAQQKDACARWAGFLTRVGIKKGDYVGIVSPNHYQYPTVYVGTMSVGAISCPINPLSTPAEIAKLYKKIQPKVIVVHPLCEASTKAAMGLLNYNPTLVVFGTSAEGANMDDILADERISLSDPVELSGEEGGIILFSSGTTGEPKGTVLTHNGLSCNLEGILHPHFFHTKEEHETLMMILPLFHISGTVGHMLMAMALGHKLVSVSKFEPSAFLSTIIDNQIGKLLMVPTILNFLVAHPGANKDTMKHVYTIMIGAAPVPPESAYAFKKKIDRDLVFQEVYGLTETMVTNVIPVEQERIGYCGPPVANTLMKVINIETGEALPANTPGEICMKSPNLMKEYLHNPEATSESITSDGWFKSGDIGIYDEDGFFKIVDRTKDLIKTKSLQVSPSEIENVLLSHPKISEAAVIGVPHERYGEVPKAYLIADGVSDAEVHEFLEDKVSPHKKLAGGIVFLKELPKTGSGKVSRKILRDQY